MASPGFLLLDVLAHNADGGASAGGVIEGQPSNLTVSREGRKWFVSIQTKREVENPLHPSSSMVGINLGVMRFAKVSNGEVIDPCHALKNKQARLNRYQRMMARREKFSQNWKKAKAKVNAIYRKVANIRDEFLRQTTAAISKNHAIVVIEDLQVRNMSKSATGTKENPGSNVKPKSESGHPRSGLGRVAPATAIQAGVARRTGAGGSAAPYQSGVPAVPADLALQSQEAGIVFVLRFPGQCGRCLRHQHTFSRHPVLRDEGQDTAEASAGWETTARIACEVNGAVMPSAAGPRGAPMRLPLGISGLQAGEDVKE